MSFCLVSEKNIFLAIDPNDYSSPETENKKKKRFHIDSKKVAISSNWIVHGKTDERYIKWQRETNDKGLKQIVPFLEVDMSLC